MQEWSHLIAVGAPVHAVGVVIESGEVPRYWPSKSGGGDVIETEKRDADYIFYELTRSVCPRCLETIDAQILLKNGRVVMRKRCPTHGWFEALISSDAEMYLASLP